MRRVEAQIELWSTALLTALSSKAFHMAGRLLPERADLPPRFSWPSLCRPIGGSNTRSEPRGRTAVTLTSRSGDARKRRIEAP
jgi:hypothetical protein